MHVTCVVSDGDTPLTIEWLKDGRPLHKYQADKSEMRTHQVDQFDSALMIVGVSQEHNGNYTCRANNSAASVSRSDRLLVHGTSRVGDVIRLFTRVY